jgi:hypothetical protein
MIEGLGAAVSAAATRTMCASARVVVTFRTAMPDLHGELTYAGVIDFDTDRCRLDEESRAGQEAEAPSIIFDGSTSYTSLQDGRWTFTRGAPGTRGMFDPCGLLDALVRAQTSAVAIRESLVEVGLDHDVLDAAADAGLAPEWESSAIAQLAPSGRIARVTLTHRSRADADAWLQVDCTISELDRFAAIDLPPPDKTVSLQQYLEQEHGFADPPR